MSGHKAGMKKPGLSLSTVLMGVLLIGVSCSWSPQDQPASSEPNNVSAHSDGTKRQERLADAESGPDRTQGSARGDVAKRQGKSSEPPRAVSRSSEVDLNSGDLREQEYASDGSRKTAISETALSREARRLGIHIPDQRNWALISSGPTRGEEGAYADGVYAFVVERGKELVQILKDAKLPDEERRAILEKFMVGLRTDDPRRARELGYRLILDIAEKHGLYAYLKTQP